MGYCGRNMEAKRLVDAVTPRWQHVKHWKASLRLTTPTVRSLGDPRQEQRRQTTNSLPDTTHKISPPHPTSHPSQMTLVKLAWSPFLTLVVALDYYLSFSEKRKPKNISRKPQRVFCHCFNTQCVLSAIFYRKNRCKQFASVLRDGLDTVRSSDSMKPCMSRGHVVRPRDATHHVLDSFATYFVLPGLSA